MKCLIIAAGKGQRLQSIGASKPLIPLCGTALIERTIMQAQLAGVDACYVVTGHQHEQVEIFLQNLSQRITIPVTPIFNPNWNSLDNGASVLCAGPYLNEPFLLLMADHMFDESIAADLMQQPVPDDGMILAVDYAVDNPLIDPDDVTRVKTSQGKIQAIGKHLSVFDAYDTGIFVVTPGLFDVLEKSCAGVGGSDLSAGVQRLAGWGKAATFDIGGRFWIDVDDPVAFWRAENALLKRCHPDASDSH